MTEYFAEKITENTDNVSDMFGGSIANSFVETMPDPAEEKGITLWLTGLSCSGKSTLAAEIKKSFGNKRVQILDGDVVRQSMGNIFGYTKKERLQAAGIYRMICNLLNEHGVHVIVAAIAGYRELRRQNREIIKNYNEIYIDCGLDVCIRRDVKGMYKKALSGELSHMMGLDEKFDIPEDADLTINTEKNSVEECVMLINSWLVSQNKI